MQVEVGETRQIHVNSRVCLSRLYSFRYTCDEEPIIFAELMSLPSPALDDCTAHTSLNPGKSNMSLHGLQLVIRATATHKALYDITIRVIILIPDYELCTVLRVNYAVVEELS